MEGTVATIPTDGNATVQKQSAEISLAASSKEDADGTTTTTTTITTVSDGNDDGSGVGGTTTTTTIKKTKNIIVTTDDDNDDNNNNNNNADNNDTATNESTVTTVVINKKSPSVATKRTTTTKIIKNGDDDDEEIIEETIEGNDDKDDVGGSGEEEITTTTTTTKVVQKTNTDDKTADNSETTTTVTKKLVKIVAPKDEEIVEVVEEIKTATTEPTVVTEKKIVKIVDDKEKSPTKVIKLSSPPPPVSSSPATDADAEDDEEEIIEKPLTAVINKDEEPPIKESDVQKEESPVKKVEQEQPIKEESTTKSEVKKKEEIVEEIEEEVEEEEEEEEEEEDEEEEEEEEETKTVEENIVVEKPPVKPEDKSKSVEIIQESKPETIQSQQQQQQPQMQQDTPQQQQQNYPTTEIKQENIKNQLKEIISDIDRVIELEDKKLPQQQQQPYMIQPTPQQHHVSTSSSCQEYQDDGYTRKIQTFERSEFQQSSTSTTSAGKPIDLQKIFTPATDADEILPKNRKLFSSSAFYSPNLHPTVEDQVELARRISHSLSDISNQQSKGQTMYVNRKKRSVKWVHEGEGKNLMHQDYNGGCYPGYYGEQHKENETLQQHNKLPLKLVMNPRGQIRDYTSNRQEYDTTTTGLLSPDKCAELVAGLNAPKGRGAELFAKRRKKSEKWIIDETNASQQSPSGVQPYGSISPNYLPAYSDVGVQRVQLNMHQDQVQAKYAQPQLKLIKTPWDAALETGSAITAFQEVPTLQQPSNFLQQQQQQQQQQTYQSGLTQSYQSYEPVQQPQPNYASEPSHYSKPQPKSWQPNSQRDLAYKPSVPQGWNAPPTNLPKEYYNLSSIISSPTNSSTSSSSESSSYNESSESSALYANNYFLVQLNNSKIHKDNLEMLNSQLDNHHQQQLEQLNHQYQQQYETSDHHHQQQQQQQQYEFQQNSIYQQNDYENSNHYHHQSNYETQRNYSDENYDNSEQQQQQQLLDQNSNKFNNNMNRCNITNNDNDDDDDDDKLLSCKVSEKKNIFEKQIQQQQQQQLSKTHQQRIISDDLQKIPIKQLISSFENHIILEKKYTNAIHQQQQQADDNAIGGADDDNDKEIESYIFNKKLIVSKKSPITTSIQKSDSIDDRTELYVPKEIPLNGYMPPSTEKYLPAQNQGLYNQYQADDKSYLSSSKTTTSTLYKQQQQQQSSGYGIGQNESIIAPLSPVPPKHFPLLSTQYGSCDNEDIKRSTSPYLSQSNNNAGGSVAATVSSFNTFPVSHKPASYYYSVPPTMKPLNNWRGNNDNSSVHHQVNVSFNPSPLPYEKLAKFQQPDPYDSNVGIKNFYIPRKSNRLLDIGSSSKVRNLSPLPYTGGSGRSVSPAIYHQQQQQQQLSPIPLSNNQQPYQTTVHEKASSTFNDGNTCSKEYSSKSVTKSGDLHNNQMISSTTTTKISTTSLSNCHNYNKTARGWGDNNRNFFANSSKSAILPQPIAAAATMPYTDF